MTATIQNAYTVMAGYSGTRGVLPKPRSSSITVPNANEEGHFTVQYDSSYGRASLFIRTYAKFTGYGTHSLLSRLKGTRRSGYHTTAHFFA